MNAVTDTSPICYLILIGEVSLLRELFSSVFIPRAVLAELLDEDAPASVRTWAANLPSWISVVVDDPPGLDTPIPGLQTGEHSAILLADSHNVSMILLDEKSARRVAIERRLRVTGTLGILGEAATRGLTDLAAAIERLRKTNFRYSPALLKATLERSKGH